MVLVVVLDKIFSSSSASERIFWKKVVVWGRRIAGRRLEQLRQAGA